MGRGGVEAEVGLGVGYQVTGCTQWEVYKHMSIKEVAWSGGGGTSVIQEVPSGRSTLG